ncbi:MAG: YqgE/AlgH family protein [Bryobacteraceae bacterium]
MPNTKWPGRRFTVRCRRFRDKMLRMRVSIDPPGNLWQRGQWMRRPLPALALAAILPGLMLFAPGRLAEADSAALLPAQSGVRIKRLDVGKFLVASRDLPDPNFSETVVLLTQYDEEAVMGLVINRPTRIPLSRVFEEVQDAKGGSDPIFSGGPVRTAGVLALHRSPTKVEEAQRIFDDVYLVSTTRLLEKLLLAGPDRSVFRVYLGYAGWAPGQLEREVELGAWHIFPGDSAAVFHLEPESVWPRLIRRTETVIAGSGRLPVLLPVQNFADVASLPLADDELLAVRESQ